MKKFLRGFGIAFFLIGALMVLGEKIHLPYISQQTSTDKKDVAKLEEQLKTANKQITDLEKTIEEQKKTTENKAESKSAKEKSKSASEETKKTADQSNSTETKTDATKKEAPIKATLYVYQGLNPSDIAEKLKDLKIIKNSVEMELFLAQKEYKHSIQIGQYELNSDMTIEEIANLITDKE